MLKRLILSLCLTTLPLAAEEPIPQEAKVAPEFTHPCTPLPEIPATAQPNNIIFMIGDGMGAEQVWAGRLVNKGDLNLNRMPVTGFSVTVSASHTITDSAAGGTALACGHKTTNGYVGETPDGAPVDSLLTLAESMGKSTGLAVTKDITDATPAAFYAHSADRRRAKDIAAYLPRCGVDFVRGGGSKHFSKKQLESMQRAGMDIKLPSSAHYPAPSKRGMSLAADVRDALAALEKNGKGFFLMVEGSQIDTAAHSNDLQWMVEEVLDFDLAVGTVLEWMQQHPDTLLVITADHQTGGLSLLDGDAAEGTVQGVFTTKGHSGVCVPVYAAGAGAAAFTGTHDNTQIYALLKAAMQQH